MDVTIPTAERIQIVLMNLLRQKPRSLEELQQQMNHLPATEITLQLETLMAQSRVKLMGDRYWLHLQN